MKRLLLLPFVICWLDVAGQHGPPNPDASPKATYKAPSDFSYNLIPSANNTWGYEIMVNNKVMVRQRTIPGIPGNEGFKTKEGAEKVAKLVIEKIRTGMIPPSVSLNELENLNVL